MLPTVSGVRLTLLAGRIEIPLQELSSRLPPSESRLRPPRFDAPTVSDEFELKPMRDIAVRELLRHAVAGTARVHLPLLGATLKKGPFAVQIPDRAEAVIDFVVEDGRIIRDKARTKGTIKPEIGLPLGLKFRGIYLDDDGSIIADIARFPNINLSWLNVAKLLVPATLNELVDLLFGDGGDDDTGAEQAGEQPPDDIDGDGKSLAVQMEGLLIEARQIEPRVDKLVLGELGSVELGASTRLDVDYSRDELGISGSFDVLRADLSGFGFALSGLRGVGTGIATLLRSEGKRRVAVGLRLPEAAFDEATLNLVDGSQIELAEATLVNVEVQLVRSGQEAHWQFEAERLTGRLTGGVLMTWIGGRRHPLKLAEMEIDGGIRLSDRGFEVDLQVSGAHLELDTLHLPLGVADLQFSDVVATGNGRLEAGSELGYRLSGSFAVSGELTAGHVDAGPMQIKLVEGTHLALTVETLAGKDGLEELQASGSIDVQLDSGSIPIGPNSQLTFSRGATGTIAIESLELDVSDSPWPRLQAGAQLTAKTDPVVLPGILELPGGEAQVEIPVLALTDSGHLTLEEVSISIGSAAHGAAAQTDRQAEPVGDS